MLVNQFSETEPWRLVGAKRRLGSQFLPSESRVVWRYSDFGRFVVKSGSPFIVSNL